MVYPFQIKALSLLARLRLLNVLAVRPRRLNSRRLDVILDLKSVNDALAKKEGESDPPSGYGHAQVLFFGNDQLE
jgi:hypothetical protein